jgi:hypothetical protein
VGLPVWRAVAASLGLLIWLTPAAGASETRALSVRIPLRETVFNECEGLEQIHLSGVVHFVSRVIVDESHGELDIHDVEHSNWEGVRGVGQETGASYVVRETFNNVLERKDPGANEYTFVFKISIIGRGVVDNYLYKARAHMTLNANGDVTVRFLDFGATCRG